MAFVPKKTLLYSDLFKNHQPNMIKEEERQSSWSNSSFSSISSLNSSSQSFLCDSSSSGLGTPPDLGSLGADDAHDFIAELTRQMAECMLQEEEKEDDKNYASVVAELEIQPPPVTKQGQAWPGRQAKGKRRSQRQKKLLQKADRNHTPNTAVGGQSGSGMQAVFIGSGSGYGSSGTGVFLPRTAGLPMGAKKKSGCSMVLMPTRVLQVLELHFKRLQDEGSRWSQAQQENGSSGGDEDENMTRLPQEWTYEYY